MFCVVSTSASDCLERLVSEMTCFMWVERDLKLYSLTVLWNSHGQHKYLFAYLQLPTEVCFWCPCALRRVWLSSNAPVCCMPGELCLVTTSAFRPLHYATRSKNHIVCEPEPTDREFVIRMLYNGLSTFVAENGDFVPGNWRLCYQKRRFCRRFRQHVWTALK